MLQQTQVSRVLAHYGRFLRRFPSMRSLARAPRRDVILAWSGMGYNNRAVRLHALASVLVARGMRIPADAPSLLELPGIGKYTAHAILSSVHGLPVPVVDVNIRRLLSRVFWRMRSTSDMKTDEEIWRKAGKILPRRGVYDWNQALMDIGATICTARRPSCARCPLHEVCASGKTMMQARGRPGRPEAGRRGTPDRIYRGRIVEALRKRRDGFRAHALGRRIDPEFSAHDLPWLEKVLEGLARDGLVRFRRGSRTSGSRVTLS
ncbi:MAG TPA: A/G-specific adenine glycosylase [Bacteroidota bacterium]|nr:A/G-specific adenine glycosylase [Bacteroidota bacterium]